MVDGKYAVLTGLLGLDCAHACGSELHPVWAFALRVNDSPNDETWAMFVRNWGDEGFCGDADHYLDLQTIRVRLPWRPGATSVTVQNAEFLTNSQQVTGPSLEPVANQSVSVVFTLPAPEAHARVNGVLHLQWAGSTTTPTARGARAGAPLIGGIGTRALRTPILRQPVKDATDPEARVAAALANMPVADRQRLLASLPPKSTVPDQAVLHATMLPMGAPHVAPTVKPRVRAVTNDPVQNVKRQRREMISQALKGRIP
jgi:hypothetical protein